MNKLDLLIQTRKNIIGLMDGFSVEELNQIPYGFNNNIIWNFAHIMVAQQILCYKLSDLPMQIRTDYIDRFKKGSKPELPVTEKEIHYFKKFAFNSLDQLKADLENNIFNTYQSYLTSYGFQVDNIFDVIRFLEAHEALHLGYVMAQRRVLKSEKHE